MPFTKYAPIKSRQVQQKQQAIVYSFSYFISQFIPSLKFLSIVRSSVMARFSKTGSLTGKWS